MLDRTTHPFIVNTLDSDIDWDLVVWKDFATWYVYLIHDKFSQDSKVSTDAEGSTLSEALDRLEALLAGREP